MRRVVTAAALAGFAAGSITLGAPAIAGQKAGAVTCVETTVGDITTHKYVIMSKGKTIESETYDGPCPS